MQKRFLLFVSLVLAFTVLTSCSGKGSTVSPPGASTLSVSVGLKQLSFTWTGASGTVNNYALEYSPGGTGATFTQVGSNIATGTTSLVLPIADHLLNWPTAQYEIEACNSGGCTASAPISIASGVLQSIGYFKASNTTTNYSFGFAVSVSGDGNTIAVGSPQEASTTAGINSTPNSNTSACMFGCGAAYVFVKTAGTNTWTQQAYIKPFNTQANGDFGVTVALSSDGNTLAVGSNGEASDSTAISSATTCTSGPCADTSIPFAGAVYVFSRSGSTWTQQAYLKANNNAATFSGSGTGFDFGYSLAISNDGNTVAVGADQESSTVAGINSTPIPTMAGVATGAAYVFTRSGTAWTQQAYVKPNVVQTAEEFYLVALSGDGNTLAVGAQNEASGTEVINGSESDTSVTNAGAVFLFTRSGTSWTQADYIKPSNAKLAGGQEFSRPALNTNGSTLAVGAPDENSNATGVSTTASTNNADTAAGAVYVFTLSGTTWSQQVYVKASNTRANAEFGIAVALDGAGNILAVGSSQETSNATGINGNQANTSEPYDGTTNFGAGAVYVFTLTGTTWSQAGYVKPTDTAVNDFFGLSVGLSTDGQTLVAGGSGDNSSATGVDGSGTANGAPASGAAYVY